ncbi:hypothetical protein EDD86DRAFT_210233 [Gorgonomyces haynaldii]|nr:hypothetical protein EDD86DRAFT_210233 [Gorgonomyces haynaldii]
MKCVGIWYLEAIRALKQQGKRLKKTLWLTFVPDEEIGGSDGMKKFIVSPEFQQLNAGFALDEGLANETNAFKVYYGERAPWWIKLKAKGGAGHGSKFIEPNATVRLLKVLDRFSSFRQHELNRLEYGKHDDGRPLLLGDVTTVNITILQAGQQTNVVPEEAIAHVDCRVAPTVDHDKFEKLLRSWCAPEQVELEFLQVFRGNGMTHIQTLKEYELLSEVAKKHQIPLEPEIFPAATDSRFLRQIGLNCLGISAIRNHPVLLHDHDEYLNEKTFIEGIDFYRDFLSAIGNLEY